MSDIKLAESSQGYQKTTEHDYPEISLYVNMGEVTQTQARINVRAGLAVEFAAWLQQCPPEQQNAFKEVITRTLHRSLESAFKNGAFPSGQIQGPKA